MVKELEYPFDPDYILKYKKRLRRELINDGKDRIKKKIAVLGGSTTDDIVKILDLFLLNAGIEAEFYQSEYGKYYEDALFPNALLDEFKPDLVYIYVTNRNITKLPSVLDSEDAVKKMLDDEVIKLRQIWDAIRKKYNCPVIQNNYELPFYRFLGNMDASDVHGSVNFISRLNCEIYQRINESSGVYLCDLNYIASDYGLNSWHNPMNWYMYKYAMDIPAIPYLAFNLANIIKAVFGKSKKGFVLDLDNTLWGGIAGDDGIDNLKIGKEEPVGQAFYEFQEYIKKFKEIGIILAVDSKNDEKVAKQGLENPECALNPNDFLIIRANWDPKDINFELIAQELNVLPESLVFVDDNPAEREIVSKRFPDAAVPRIGSVQDYIKCIDRSGFFETVRISADDLNRTKMYKENITRSKLEAQFTNYKEYLLNLEMRAVIGAFDEKSIPRVTQLINKTNQFNLTTKRCTQEEIESIAKDKSYICLDGKLYDKFGDNGIVTVLIGRITGTECHVVLWLMSCRVLKRDLEKAMMDELIRCCADSSVQEIIGYYYPTAKNGMVKDFYGDMGFTKISEDDKGNTEWALKVNQYKPLNEVIKVDKKEK